MASKRAEETRQTVRFENGMACTLLWMIECTPPPPAIKSQRAVSLVEVLVAIVIVAVLVSLSSVAIRGTRAKAQQVARLSDIRQIASTIMVYASENSDRPPVVFAPPDHWPEREQSVSRQNRVWIGNWFANSSLYFLAFDPPLPDRVLIGAVQPQRFTPQSQLLGTPYRLTQALYADAAYWTPEFQRPLLGWSPQRIDAVSLPSQKGMVDHPKYFDASQVASGAIPDFAPAPSTVRETLVAWFDLSASMESQSRLHPGIANRFSFYADPASSSRYDAGAPVLNTRLGLAGVDR